MKGHMRTRHTASLTACLPIDERTRKFCQACLRFCPPELGMNGLHNEGGNKIVVCATYKREPPEENPTGKLA